MEEEGVTIQQLVDGLQMSQKDVNSLLNGKIKINEHIAQKLSSLLGCSPQMWLNWQEKYDIEEEMYEMKKHITKQVRKMEKFFSEYTNMKIRTPVHVDLTHADFNTATEKTIEYFQTMTKVLEKKYQVSYIKQNNQLEVFYKQCKNFLQSRNNTVVSA